MDDFLKELEALLKKHGAALSVGGLEGIYEEYEHTQASIDVYMEYETCGLGDEVDSEDIAHVLKTRMQEKEK